MTVYTSRLGKKMALTEAAVRAVACKCFVPSDYPNAAPITLKAMAATVYVAADRLRANRSEVAKLLKDLSDEFRGPLGGPFERFNMTKDGQVWTTDQPTMMALLLLGGALGLLTVSEQFDLTNDLRYVMAVRIVQ